MNPLELYQKVLNHRLEEPEMDQVEAWIRQYPYFALPYFLKARQTKDKMALFEASIYASNRFLLKRFMDGSIIIQERKFSEVIEEHLKMSNRPFSMGENDTFSVVDFDAIHDPGPVKEIPFQHKETRQSFQDNFLNWEVKVRTLKYLGLVGKIEHEIQKNAFPFIPQRNSNEYIVEEKKAHLPVGEPETVVQVEKEDLWEQFLKEVPTLKANLGKESPLPDEQAMESVSGGEEMVSETLAHIHLLQKNYGEAIRIYEKLSLLFPEKKAYFANQIKMINNE